MANNQSPERFRTTWGEFASDAELPNVAGASTASRNLAVGDVAFVTGVGLYMCADPTRGAAVWVLIGAISGSARVGTPSLSGFSVNQPDLYYEGADTLYRATATATYTTLIYIRGVAPSVAVNQRIAGTNNANGGVTGWFIDVLGAASEGDDPVIRFGLGTSTGGVVTISRALNKPQDGSPSLAPGNTPQSRLILVQVVAAVVAGTLTLTMYINGQQCGPAEATGGVGVVAPSPELFLLGADPGGLDAAEEINILGVGIHAQALAKTLVWNIARRTFLAGGLVDVPESLSYSLMHSAINFASEDEDGVAFPPTTWTPAVGAGNLTRENVSLFLYNVPNNY